MAPRTSTGPRRLRRKLGLIALEAWLPVTLFALWWFTSADSTSPYFVSLRSILDAFDSVWLFDGIQRDVVPSLLNLAAGLAIATAVGVGAGLLLGLVRPLADAVGPVVEFLRAIPGVALLPLGLLLLGIGPRMQIAMIAYGTLWPILLNTIDGVRSIDPTVRDVARSFQIPLSLRLRAIVLPAACPQMITGMRTSLSIGIAIIVFSEMVASTEGIGFVILQAQRSFSLPEMWSGILLLGVLGYLLNIGFRAVERLVLGWHRGMVAASGR